MSYQKEYEFKLYTAILGWRKREIDGESVLTLDTRQVDGHLTWEVDQVRWRWAMGQACRALQLDLDGVSVDYVSLPTGVSIAGVTPYVRKFRDKGGARREQRHESIRSSAAIRVRLLVLDSLEYGGEDTRPPTERELLDIFRLIGDNIGLSPFGSSLGYGRFSVTEVRNEKGKENEKAET